MVSGTDDSLKSHYTSVLHRYPYCGMCGESDLYKRFEPGGRVYREVRIVEDSLITKVIHRYHPDWDPPEDRSEWVSALCPFHGESRPSASVSFRNDAFACFACGEKGDALAILMRKEGIGYLEALEVAERISPGSHEALSREPAKKPGRRSFGGTGSDRVAGDVGADREAKARVRRRSFTRT